MEKYGILNKLLLLVFVFVSGCTTLNDNMEQRQNALVSNFIQETPITYANTKIITHSKYVPIKVGRQDYNLNASVEPESEASTILFKSDNPATVFVSSKGNVSIYKAGIAKINISLKQDSSINTQVYINAYETSTEADVVPVMAVAVDKTYLKIKKGSELPILPSVYPGNATNKKLGYLSTNDSVAVMENGFIKAKSEGKTSIIIYAESNPEKYALISIDVEQNDESSFTAPKGVTPIDLNKDPLSLIAKYQVLNYSINGEKAKIADVASNLRVNVDLKELSAGIVNILMYVNLNGKEAKLIQKKRLSGSIPDIFTSLGAEITGKYTMTFTLDYANYTELARQKLINKGDTLVLNIGKIQALTPAGDLGSDIEFDMATVPVEGENSDDIPDNNEDTENTDNTTVTEIQVENITLDTEEFSAVNINEIVELKAKIYPENADNKTLIWQSSANDVASVDKDGRVTIHKNGQATITARATNGVEASMRIIPATVDDFKLDIENKTFILNVDTKMQLTYSVYPVITYGENHHAIYSSSDPRIAKVDNSGNITALSEGETSITVTIGNVRRDCYVKVLSQDALATAIPVTGIAILETAEHEFAPTFGYFKLKDYIQVQPPNATDKRFIYESSNPNVAEVNVAGTVTIKNIGTANIKITSFNNKSVSATYSIIVETLPTGIVFERFDYGVAIGETTRITPIYHGNPTNTSTTFKILGSSSVASVEEKTGTVRGLSSGTVTLEAVAKNGKRTTTTITVYTPVVKGNVRTLQGTYQIMDFSQRNGVLDVGTKDYGGVERMIGEMTIDVSGNTVYIKSKIQMNSSKMNNYESFGSTQAKQGQFQYTEYAPAGYNQDGFGSSGKTSARVTHDNDMLRISQQWQEFTVTVQVNTWIKKKSDTVKDLQKGYFYWSKDGANMDRTANAVAHHRNIRVPDNEPYYTFGLITK